MPKILENILACSVLLAGTTGIGQIFHTHHLPDTTIVMVYMVCVLIAASITEGFVYGIGVAFLAMGTFNYFFVSPYLSLNVDNTSYVISLGFMLLAAIITSMITSKGKMKEKEARERENGTVSLLKLTNQVAEAQDMKELAVRVVKYIRNILKCKAACMITTEEGRLYSRYLNMTEMEEPAWKELTGKEELEKVFYGTLSREFADRDGYRNWPIYGQEGLLGILSIPLPEVRRMKRAQVRMLDAVRETVRLAMERICVRRQQMKDNAMMERERYRSTLLRSISHDLRTPLAGIIGTSEILLDMMKEEDEKEKLLKNIGQDAQWLYELVENVLNLTRMQDGELIHKEQEACEEAVEAAVRRVQDRLGGRRIQVLVPKECLVVSMDVRLIEQVLVNMLDNAVKHTAENGNIRIIVDKQREEAVFEVMDDGTGLLEQDIPHIFQLFYTTLGENTDKDKGTGMGLAICDSIVTAHEGRIWAENRKDGNGAVFRFSLPV